MKKNKDDNKAKQERIHQKKLEGLEKKVKELNKRYKDSQYEIQKRTSIVRGKEHDVYCIVRKVGRRPHKVQNQQSVGKETNETQGTMYFSRGFNCVLR